MRGDVDRGVLIQMGLLLILSVLVVLSVFVLTWAVDLGGSAPTP